MESMSSGYKTGSTRHLQINIPQKAPNIFIWICDPKKYISVASPFTYKIEMLMIILINKNFG